MHIFAPSFDTLIKHALNLFSCLSFNTDIVENKYFEYALVKLLPQGRAGELSKGEEEAVVYLQTTEDNFSISPINLGAQMFLSAHCRLWSISDAYCIME